MFLQNNLKYINAELVESLAIIYSRQEAGSIAKLLLDFIGYSNVDLITKGQTKLKKEHVELLEKALERLQNHEPIQYVIGSADFYGLVFKVNPSVLIPRQETEELVELIIKENVIKKPKILDIGTGSGCIALSLKKNIPEGKVDGLDVSKSALEVAMINSKAHNLNVHFHHLDILHEAILPGDYDIIVSNPPYVTEKEKSELLGNVLYHEPHTALFIPDHSPLIFYECIIELSLRHLNPKGKLYFEINARLGDDIMALLNESGFQQVRIIKDLNGKNRFAAGCLNSKI